ncbi:MAG: cell division protein FtsL [Elusimicrobiaceae bacterium]|nr:cell division protein FtsL [Elusimicrobiaceae bacterium]
MKLFAVIFFSSLFILGVTMMRTEVNRSGRAIGKLQNEVEIKEARNQYLKLEIARLSGPETIQEIAQDKLHLRRTPPQQVIILED